jgi:hypothetical protein
MSPVNCSAPSHSRIPVRPVGVGKLLAAVAGNTLTALPSLRDVLPGFNAGSLLIAVLPNAPGGLRPGEATSGQRITRTRHDARLHRLLRAPPLTVTRRRDVA